MHQATAAQPLCAGMVAFVSGCEWLCWHGNLTHLEHVSVSAGYLKCTVPPSWRVLPLQPHQDEKRCITGFAFPSRLTAASKHFSTYLLPILLEVSIHFLAGACFLEGTEVTCHFLSHVT